MLPTSVCARVIMTASLAGSIHNVAIYDDVDPRKTESEYASIHNLNESDLKDELASTGKTRCGSVFATANVTLDKSVITTAAHVLCDSKVAPKACTFRYKFRNVEKLIPVERLFAQGITCPQTAGHNQDWAVLELKVPVEGPIPYNINKEIVNSLPKPKALVSVGALSADLCLRDKFSGCIRDPQGLRLFRYYKYVEDCQERNIAHTAGVPAQIFSDCAVAAGASGGPALDTGLSEPVLLAILAGAMLNTKEDLYERTTGSPVSRPYRRIGKDLGLRFLCRSQERSLRRLRQPQRTWLLREYGVSTMISCSPRAGRRRDRGKRGGGTGFSL